jgi:CheY-like chemotaxis protein
VPPFEQFRLMIIGADLEANRRVAEAAAKTRRFPFIREMSDGRFALEHIWDCIADAREPLPDIMVVDFQLAGLNGVQLTRELRRYAETRDIFIAFLTGDGGALEQDAAESAGCDFFLHRPAEVTDLSATLISIANRCAAKANVPARFLN